ncbi:glycerophosphodiester phosphodiesterase family protein [Mesorhizobium japonicum]|uniref:Mlr9158 protein n=1 Tax=Mesorhizobium japonicum (strain LMG 29417 / CECT 9101 / MAFF 303099) TaxID=266835 RepID=Q982A7_RHILO|nr:glycerophosphodiester phosphodiesterase family protein [Mesorhizobium japonicum]BAB54552.1 mlr9158 [Mesorhizobium japonicum MAFF 303099]
MKRYNNNKSMLRTVSSLLLLSTDAALAPEASAADVPRTCVYQNYKILDVWKNLNTKRNMAIVIAHRGWWGDHKGPSNSCGANVSYASGQPENSIDAVIGALHNGFEAVEVDIKMTRDGVPILMHDYTLGRTTDIYQGTGQPKFDPSAQSHDQPEGYNPYVNQIDWYGDLEHHYLLSPDRSRLDSQHIPTFTQLLDSYRSKQTSGIVVLDVKDRGSMQEVWRLMNNHRDSHGSLARNWVAVKFNVSTYPNPADLEADLFKYADPHNDNSQEPFLGIPLLTNNMLDKFHNLIEIEKNYLTKDYTLGMEVNLNMKNGRLQNAYNLVGQSRKPVGIFNPIADPGAWDGDGHNRAFFMNTGQCCYRLWSLAFGDGTVDRWDWSFLYGKGWKAFDFITTDEAGKMIDDLAAKGLRGDKKAME